MSSYTITNQPRNRASGNAPHGHQRRPVARHNANCANCGVPTTLPFKPTPERLGYCPACFRNRAQTLGIKPERPARSDASRGAEQGQPAERRERPNTKPHPEVFSELDIAERTRSALHRMGIESPTPIQEQTIPWLNEGRDVVGQAQTGSGKTLAFGIPLVESCEASTHGVQGLVLVPTRELAIQVASVIEDVAERRVSVMLLYGGRSLVGEKRALERGAQIIVGTPGRTLDHLRQRTLSLGSVHMLVLDEADEMLDRGFTHDVEAILAETPSTRQTALFSATMPDWVAKTSKKHLRDPKTVTVINDAGDALKIEHIIYKMEKATKTPALRTLLDQRGNAPILIFGRTKHGVKKLAKQLEELGYPVAALQGNLSQNAREKAMEEFRSGVAPVLVATNVAARGLDVDGIAQVINYDLPDSLQLFTHRVGRTGRMGKSGEAITFVTPDEEKKWREIEQGFDTSFEIKRWGPQGPEDLREPTQSPRQAPRRQASSGSSRGRLPAASAGDLPAQARRVWHGLRRR